MNTGVTTICPLHRAASKDLVSTTSSGQQVFRCSAGHMGPVAGNTNPGPAGHYFTLTADTPPSADVKARKGRK